MIKTVDCPRCNGGTIKINIPSGYEVITSGALSKLPCQAVCQNCNRKIKYMVVRTEDYEKTLEWLQQK